MSYKNRLSPTEILNASGTPSNTTFLRGDNTWATPAGDSWQETFETVSKNLKSYQAAMNYSGGVLSSLVYTTEVGTITKTLNYTGDKLTSVVLSGDTPSGITLTKTLTYTGDALTGVAYS